MSVISMRIYPTIISMILTGESWWVRIDSTNIMVSVTFTNYNGKVEYETKEEPTTFVMCLTSKKLDFQ